MRNRNTLRALHLASPGIRTVTESQLIHLRNHSLSPPRSLRTTLRKQGKRTNPGGNKKHSRTVLTGSNTSAATNASSRIHTLLSLIVRNKNIIGILGRTGTNRNETTCLQNLVESPAVNYKILDNRESSASERLYSDSRSILEMPHKQLTGSHMIIGTVSTSVDVKRAGTANTLTAIMVERHRTAALATSLNGYRIATLADKLLIENIKHLQERSILFYTLDVISLKMSFCFGVLLTPYLKIEFHLDYSL